MEYVKFVKFCLHYFCTVLCNQVNKYQQKLLIGLSTCNNKIVNISHWTFEKQELTTA